MATSTVYSTLSGNVRVAGQLSADSLVVPAGTLTDNGVSATAAIGAAKLQQQYAPTLALCDHATSAAAVRKVIHAVYGATGTVIAFGAGSTVIATSTGTCTVTLKKNGSAILTASIVLDTGNTVNVIEAAAGFSDTTLVAGDVLEVEITGVSGSAVPKGVFCRLVVREDAAP